MDAAEHEAHGRVCWLVSRGDEGGVGRVGKVAGGCLGCAVGRVVVRGEVDLGLTFD